MKSSLKLNKSNWNRCNVNPTEYNTTRNDIYIKYIIVDQIHLDIMWYNVGWADEGGQRNPMPYGLYETLFNHLGVFNHLSVLISFVDMDFVKT